MTRSSKSASGLWIFSFLLVARFTYTNCAAEQELGFLGRPFLPYGNKENAFATTEGNALASNEEALRALRSLKDGQTLQLNIDEVELRRKIILRASDVHILGAEPSTRVKCPPRGDAFFVKGRNVTFERLTFSQCKNGSAVHVSNGKDATSNELVHLSEWNAIQGIVPTRVGLGDGHKKWSCAKDSRSKRKPCVIVVDSSFINNEAYEGAAILATGAKVMAKNVRFSRNEATNGAAVFFHRSDVLIQNSEFTENYADEQGGAIFAGDNSHMKILKSTFKNNSADVTGGAIKLQKSSKLKTEQSTFEDNWTKKFEGGAVVGCSSSLAFFHTSFLNNVAQGSGGAIYLYKNSILVADSSVFTSNNAKSGGAVMSRRSHIVVRNSTFAANLGRTSGGAFYATVASAMTVDNSKFFENSVKLEGGAIRSQKKAELNITACAFERNEAKKASGGAISGAATLFHILNSSFTNNSARENGGAIAVSRKSNLLVSSSKFLSNQAKAGGALANDDSAADLSKTTFEQNSASFQGGALSITRAASHRVSYSTLVSNSAKTTGGAIAGTKKASISVDKSNFTGNWAAKKGGAIAEDDSELAILHTVFSSNLADASGGAVHLSRSSPASIEHTDFAWNEATSGGALSGANHSVMVIKGSTFFENRAYGREDLTALEGKQTDAPETASSETEQLQASGGAVSASECQLTIIQSSFVSNEAEVNGGAIDWSGSCNLSIQTTSFTQNSVSKRGGAVHMNRDSGLVKVKGVNFTRNSAQAGGAISLLGFSTFYAQPETVLPTIFTENSAGLGGGLFCVECTVLFGHTIVFSGNIAIEYGGGAFVQKASPRSSVSQAVFESNVAAFGGGIALRDCERLAVGSLTGETTTFEHNVALVGGGVHFELYHARMAHILIQNCHFQFNGANKWSIMTRNTNRSSALERWNKGLDEDKTGIKESFQSGDGVHGSGGGIYIKVHDSGYGRVCAVLQNTTVINNEARDEGDVVVDNRDSRGSFTALVVPNEQMLCFE